MNNDAQHEILQLLKGNKPAATAYRIKQRLAEQNIDTDIEIVDDTRSILTVKNYKYLPISFRSEVYLYVKNNSDAGAALELTDYVVVKHTMMDEYGPYTYVTSKPLTDYTMIDTVYTTGLPVLLHLIGMRDENNEREAKEEFRRRRHPRGDRG